MLVLLSSRPKYKCAKCSGLFKQKEIDNKEFRTWNKNQRNIDIQNINLEKQRKKAFLEEKRKLKAFRILFKKKRKFYPDLSWEMRNPEKVKAMKKRYVENNREQVYDYLKQWRKNNLHEARLKQRLTHWRRQQVGLANEFFSPNNIN